MSIASKLVQIFTAAKELLPTGPNPNERLLRACEAPTSTIALSEGLIALRQGALTSASRGARAALLCALAHGHEELALALIAAGADATRPDSIGRMPLEQAISDDDIPQQFKGKAVLLLIRSGASPHGCPGRNEPLAMALCAHLDDCALAIVQSLPSASADYIPRGMGSCPLLAAAICAGCPKTALWALQRAETSAAGQRWLMERAGALCLASASSSSFPMSASRQVLAHAMRWLDSPDAELGTSDLERLLLWRACIPGLSHGGASHAFDGDPTLDLAGWICRSPELSSEGARRGFIRLGVSQHIVELGSAWCEARAFKSELSQSTPAPQMAAGPVRL